jgi:hypothetical protein
MDIGSGEFRELAHLITLTAIVCYGRPSERALEQMRHKAVALGTAGPLLPLGDSRASPTSNPSGPEQARSRSRECGKREVQRRVHHGHPLLLRAGHVTTPGE